MANLTERKNPHTPIYGVKEFVCLSVTKFNPNYLRTGETEWAEIFLGHLWQKGISQNLLFIPKMAGRAGAEGRKIRLFNTKINTQTFTIRTGGMKFATQISPQLNWLVYQGLANGKY